MPYRWDRIELQLIHIYVTKIACCCSLSSGKHKSSQKKQFHCSEKKNNLQQNFPYSVVLPTYISILPLRYIFSSKYPLFLQSEERGKEEYASSEKPADSRIARSAGTSLDKLGGSTASVDVDGTVCFGLRAIDTSFGTCCYNISCRSLVLEKFKIQKQVLIN